jgi:hypothetical protein
MIQYEVRNVIKAAAAVIGLDGVGMIAQYCGVISLVHSSKIVVCEEKRSERPD